MKKIIDFIIKSKLLVNLLVLVILAAGFAVVSNLNREAFPEVNMDMMTITTVYPGAAPDEVENLITIPIEKKLREISGIEDVEAFNIENVSVLVVYLDEMLSEKNHTKAVDDVKDAVDSITDLPEDAEEPEVKEITTEKTNAIDVALVTTKTGDQAYRELRETAKKLEDELFFIDGVAEIEKLGYRDKEYLVEVYPESLQKYRIGLNAVTRKLMARNLDLPGGALRVDGKEYLLRTIGQFNGINEVKKMVVFSNDAGFTTMLGDIAKVTDTYEEEEIMERVDFKNAIVLQLLKKKSADMITINSDIKKYLLEFEKTLPEGMSITYFNDMSRFVKARLSSLITNAAVGFVLLALILMMMLGRRLALVVGISIPVSFMISFMLMQQQGITLNVISMFALVMVLGMIVDFSIVVAENAYRHMEQGKEKVTAINDGVREVAAPITVTLFCIIAAFAPLLFVSGLIGKFIFAIPMVIIICLLSSWLCAVFVLPAYIDSLVKVSKRHADKQGDDNPGFYEKVLSKMVKLRYLVVVAIFALLMLTFWGMGKLDFVFMPSSSKGVFVKMQMPQGTNLKTTNKAIKPIEALLSSLPKIEVESIQSRVGIHMANQMDMRPKDGTHKAVAYLNLAPAGDREKAGGRSGEEIVAELRNNLAALIKEGKVNPDLDVLFELDMEGMPQGKPVSVEIRGDNLETCNEIAEKYEAYLKTIDGVHDIAIDLEKGKTEYRYKINEVYANRAGLSVSDVAQSILSSFKGAVATKVKKGDEEIDVRVRFPDWARRTENSLSDVMIENNNGGLISLDKVTSYDKGKGYATINRKNYKRVVKVDANIDLSKTTAMKVNSDLLDKFENISNEYMGYSINYGGEQEDTQESMGDLGRLFMVALAVIFVILAVFFNSLWIPVIIMICIPFSLIGVVFALLTHGQPISFMSVLGVFSLAGVIVSNTLVLVQFINNLRKNEGMTVTEAVVHGGALRFRPVILTSGTTVLGLIPTIYGLGGKDAFVAPLGLAFGYGLIFATVITLILVPCFYHVAEDIKGVWAKSLGRLGIKVNSKLIQD